MCKPELWVRGDRKTDRQRDRHINTMTRSGLGAGPSENMNRDVCSGLQLCAVISTVYIPFAGPISEEPVSEARALQPAPQPSLPLKPKEGEEGGSQLQLLQLPQSSQSLGEGGGSLLLPVSCLALVLLCLLFLGALRSSREEEEGRGSRAGSRGSRSKRGHSDQEGQTDTTLPVLAYTEEGGVEWRERGESDSLGM